MNLCPASTKGIQIGKQEGILDAAVRLVKAGIPLSQVAQILEMVRISGDLSHPVPIQQALNQGSQSQ